MPNCFLRAGSSYRLVISGEPPGPLVLADERITLEQELEFRTVWNDPAGWMVLERLDGQRVFVVDGDDAGEAPYRLETSLTEAERARVVSFGHLRILPEPAITAAAFARISKFGHQGPRCGPCLPCRNWDLQRVSLYPPALKDVMERLGIDWRKEDEVMGSKSRGEWCYSVWLRAAGTLVVAKREEMEECWRSIDVAPRTTVGFVPQAVAMEVTPFWPIEYLLVGEPIICLNVCVNGVPWVLEEETRA